MVIRSYIWNCFMRCFFYGIQLTLLGAPPRLLTRIVSPVPSGCMTNIPAPL